MKNLSLTIILVFIVTGTLTAQQSNFSRGVENYKQGRYDEAVSMLSAASKENDHKNDPEVWNYLGMALLEKNNVKSARRSFEKAIKLNPTSAAYHVNLAFVLMLDQRINKAQTELETAIRIDPGNLGAYSLRGRSNLWEGKIDEAIKDADTALSIDPSTAVAYTLKADALLSRFGANAVEGAEPKNEVGILKQAMDVLRVGISKVRGSDSASLSDQLTLISAFHDHFDRKKPPAGSAPDANVVPIKILTKPRAEYTERARMANVKGTVRLAILFGDNGKVQGVLILKRLGYGLDESAYRAATQIKFVPKTVNGKPTPAVMTFEYGFNIF